MEIIDASGNNPALLVVTAEWIVFTVRACWTLIHDHLRVRGLCFRGCHHGSTIHGLLYNVKRNN